MSVQNQIDRLNAIKNRIRTNLIAQGVAVPEDTMLEEMAAQILSVAGEDGQRGTGILPVTTAPSSYTTAVGGITPQYRMAISTIKTQAGVTEVLLGDTIRYSYYHYPIAYLDASYAYCTTRVSIRGATGKTAYAYAQDGGYSGTEAEFAEKLADEYNPNPLYGKKVSFLGDSICAGADTETSYLGGYGKIIADRNNMECQNLGKGGSTVTAETYSQSTGTAKGWLCRMVENMDADADYAIIEGGYNDAWQYVDYKNFEIGQISAGYNAVLDDTTYYGAFESMLKQLVTKFQGKKIGYIALPKIMSYYDSNRNAPNFYHIALECCAKWGVPVCDLNTIIPPFEYLKTLGTVYTADGSHPTYEGYIKYYCDPIEAWMKTLTTGGNNSAGMVVKEIESYTQGFNDAIEALRKGKLDNTGISFRKAKLPLADGTTIEIDVLTAIDGTIVVPYINRVPLSIDTDGSVFNEVGYQEGYRLSSSGVAKEQAYSVVTGYIPAKGGDVVRIFGCGWVTDAHAMSYICAYDASFTFIGALSSHAGDYTLNKYGTNINGGYEYDADHNATITLNSLTNIAYIRVSSRGATAESKFTFSPADMIVTINEEIT